MQIHTSNINSSRFPYTPYGYCENEFRQWHYTNRWKKSLTHAWKQRKHHTKLSNCCTNTIQGGLEHLSGKVWLAVQPNLIVPREAKALQEDRGVPHVILATKHDKRHDWQNDLQSWTEKLKKKNLKKKPKFKESTLSGVNPTRSRSLISHENLWKCITVSKLNTYKQVAVKFRNVIMCDILRKKNMFMHLPTWPGHLWLHFSRTLPLHGSSF